MKPPLLAQMTVTVAGTLATWMNHLRHVRKIAQSPAVMDIVMKPRVKIGYIARQIVATATIRLFQ
jgi:hypothetical protein